MVITLLSDFGDVYLASMKGVILGIHPDANIVDISHSIPRHDIRTGAFVLMTNAKYFPTGTVHLEIAVNQGNASRFFRKKIVDEIFVTKKPQSSQRTQRTTL